MEASDGQLPRNAVLLDADRHLETAFLKLGIICGGCGQALETPRGPIPAGWEYLTLEPTMRDGRPTVAAKSVTMCARAECAQKRSELMQTATARRRIVIQWELIEPAVEPENGAPDSVAAEGRICLNCGDPIDEDARTVPLPSAGGAVHLECYERAQREGRPVVRRGPAAGTD